MLDHVGQCCVEVGARSLNVKLQAALGSQSRRSSGQTRAVSGLSRKCGTSAMGNSSKLASAGLNDGAATELEPRVRRRNAARSGKRGTVKGGMVRVLRGQVREGGRAPAAKLIQPVAVFLGDLDF